MEQYKEKNKKQQANEKKGEKRQMMTEEDETSLELTGRCKGWFKGLLYGPKMLNTKALRVLTVRIRGEKKRMGSRLWDTS